MPPETEALGQTEDPSLDAEAPPPVNEATPEAEATGQTERSLPSAWVQHFSETHECRIFWAACAAFLWAACAAKP